MSTLVGSAERGCELRVAFVDVSRNRKTGQIPISMTSANTCPASCPWFGSGCYAEHHFTGMHWRRLSRGSGMSWDAFCERVRAMPPGQLWRHNEAGDLPGDGEVIDDFKLRKLSRAAEHTRGFTYTHKPVLGAGVGAWNRSAILNNGSSGLVVNVSADGLEDADAKAELGVGPVVATIPATRRKILATPAGRRVVVCPATYRPGSTCSNCGLCSRPHRGSIVAFPVHGAMAAAMTVQLVQLRLF